MRGLFSLACLCVATAACTNFPTIDSGECGNGVIDRPQEDCDTFAPDSKSVCRPKGSDGECHLDCSKRENGRAPCPPGWGCDTDSICRAPTATFGEPADTFDVGAWSLSAGDFDGDHRSDIMSSEPLDSIGGTRLSFFYFDEQGELEDTRTFPKFLLAPTVKDISGDGLSDVAFAAGSLGLMLGRKDRSWVPETFSSYHLANTDVRVVNVYTQHIEFQAPIVPLLGFADHAGFYVASLDGQLAEHAPLGGSIAQLAGDPVSGNLFEDTQSSPCLEVVFALRGNTSFTVLNTCQTDDNAVKWRNPFAAQRIPLEPAARVDCAPQVVDMNGDGHLDVLLGAGGKPYVAYGNGSRLAPAIPYRLPIVETADVSAEIPTPLAAGDFSGDGVPDFVFGDHLMVSSKDPNSGEVTYSSLLRNRLGSAWTIAKIGDFNANGKVDVVAASNGSLNLEFYNGTGTENLLGDVIRTLAPVQFLSTGDFDGDLITDLVMVEEPPAGETKSPVQVAFGSAFAPPNVPVTVAQVAEPDTLVSYQDAGIGNIVVASHETINGVQNGALTVLGGSADRIPYAPFALTELASNGSVQDSAAIAVAVGSFSAPAQADVLALAFPAPTLYAPAQPPTRPWLLPSIRSAGAAPSRLPTDLDSRLSPLHFFDEGHDFTASVASTSADLDGDHRDEAIFAMPAGAQQGQCGVVVFGATGQSSPQVQGRDPVLLDEPCADPQLAALDADADGFVDIALLTGEVGASTRKLYVLWNDGTGGFSRSSLTLVSGSDHSPQAFTTLAGSPGADGTASEARAFGFAYVTDDHTWFVGATDVARQFAAAVGLPGDLKGGSGIVAADVNGDGVVDLVVAASGKLSVLKAQLAVP